MNQNLLFAAAAIGGLGLMMAVKRTDDKKQRGEETNQKEGELPRQREDINQKERELKQREEEINQKERELKQREEEKEIAITQREEEKEIVITQIEEEKEIQQKKTEEKYTYQEIMAQRELRLREEWQKQKEKEEHMKQLNLLQEEIVILKEFLQEKTEIIERNLDQVIIPEPFTKNPISPIENLEAKFSAVALSVGLLILEGKPKGTAWVIAPNLIVTNCHCFHDEKDPKKDEKLQRLLYPRPRNLHIDFSDFRKASNNNTFKVLEIICEGKPTYETDYAFCAIEEKALNGDPQPKPIEISEKDSQDGAEVIVIGFPLGVYKAFSKGKLERVKSSKYGEIIAHDCSTLEGNSGSVMIRLDGKAVGLHFGGVDTKKTEMKNTAVMIKKVKEVLSTLNCCVYCKLFFKDPSSKDCRYHPQGHQRVYSCCWSPQQYPHDKPGSRKGCRPRKHHRPSYYHKGTFTFVQHSCCKKPPNSPGCQTQNHKSNKIQ